MTILGRIVQVIGWLGFKGVLALFFFACTLGLWTVNSNLKSQNATLTDSLKNANAMIKANTITINQNKADYEALDASCTAQIKATTAKLLAAKPQCPNGQKPVYNVKDLVK